MIEDIEDKSLSELAEIYLDAFDQEVDKDELAALRDERDEIKAEYKHFVEKYEEPDPIAQELANELERLGTEITEAISPTKIQEVAAEELLERAREFAPTEEWLTENVLQSLNLILTGEDEARLIIEENFITSSEDFDELSPLQKVRISDIIRELATDKLEESPEIRKVWKSIEGKDKEIVFRIVVDQGHADPDDVLKLINERRGDFLDQNYEGVYSGDVKREKARNDLKNTVYDLDINPYHRKHGTYHLSTVGTYLAQEYLGVSTEATVETEWEEDDESTDEKLSAGDTQSPLAEYTIGGSSDE